MGNNVSTPTPVPPAFVANNKADGQANPHSNSVHPGSSDPTSAAKSSSSSPPKCPISGQEAKNGATCAYDPTQLSFWKGKASIAAVPIPEAKEVQEVVESCPMRAKAPGAARTGQKPESTFVTVAADKYKNPNQYNVRCFPFTASLPSFELLPWEISCHSCSPFNNLIGVQPED